ncbi:PriCT-2 domain-containing protein [Aquiflexum sp. LQ15W]|uniref:BT4734/BF3469 family protein n=1 Tax=Cognataquiflexum nitidum TaxID=2922272 RepID=UPI001F13C862|nr:BT4734/BF3469 family protein [Cognataquiflexum nitidum]MCH6201317.1 PriCT-2 domain-containing protein [Cognataquiflexum nitidum]
MILKTSISSWVEEILNKKVSYQKNTWSAFSKEMTIREVLREIQSGKHKVQVHYLRSLISNDKREEYNIHKRTLPAVTFCGTFEGERKKTKIKSYNYVIVLDVDKLDEEELKRIKQCFHDDPFVFSFWESPSKEGIKGLVSLRYNFELNKDNLDIAHKIAFQKLASYFKEKHNIELDNSGNDTTRLCFFSYDPLIIFKENAPYFEISGLDYSTAEVSNENTKDIELKFVSNKDSLHNPANRNSPGDRYTIAAIIRFLEKKKLSITTSYEEWYKVAMAIANTFTYEVGERCFLKLSSMDKTKFNEIECKNFLLNCYEARRGAIKFSTIVYFANEIGYRTKKQRERGSEAVNESLSQVSSSKTVVYLPEDLKK